MAIWACLTKSVYGSVNITLALRSKFMKEVVVKIVTSTITFLGVAYSIDRTVKNNQKIESMKLSLEINQTLKQEK